MMIDASNLVFPSDLITQVDDAPKDPGVYIMKSAQGRILYVGKARNLRKRLKSYFKRTNQTDPKTVVLLGQVASIETTVTHTEKEALILESNLIKRHRPRYNVILKDDKRYPSLRLNIQHPYPNLNIVRKIKNDGALYFGPYSSALAVKQTLKFIHKTFKLRKCHSKVFLNRTRPCLNYQMGLCLAPCCLQVNQDLYHDIVKEVIAFLKGRTPDLIRQLRHQMMSASQSLEYETAAVIRDKIQALEKTLEKQVSVSNDFTDRDVIGMAQEEAMIVVTVLQVRSGYLMGSRHFRFDHTIGPLSEQMGLFLRQFYETAQVVPAEILLSEMPDDHDLVENYLQDKKSTKVNLLTPQRGEKRRLVLIAEQNAQLELKTHLKSESNQRQLMERLQDKLDLKRSPQRIECFDNSNLLGTNPVSAMVVFQDTLPLTSAYRRYKASILGQPDDYAHMMEVIRRRYGKEKNSDRDLPDLLLVDGGKGQINSVVSVLRELNLAHLFDVVGIAKKDSAKGELQDKVYLAGRVNPVNFGRDMDLLLFLQRVRDEAHRFAISYQRQRRQKEAMQSELDTISGIGPQRRVALLSRFGSVENIRNLTPDQVSTIPGINIKLARTILKELQKDR
jgi:excinuclease ABC subunit C